MGQGCSSKCKRNQLKSKNEEDVIVDPIDIALDCESDDDDTEVQVVEEWGADETVEDDLPKELHLEMKEDQNAILEEAFKNIALFNSLSASQKSTFIKQMTPITFEKGEDIVREGETGDRFFVICSGAAVVLKEGVIQTRLVLGQYFGELSLIFGGKRSATVRAVTFMELKYVTSEQYKQYENLYLSWVLHNIPLVADLSTDEQNNILSKLHPISFEAREYIIREGEVADKFYFIIKGEVIVLEENSSTITPTPTSNSSSTPTTITTSNSSNNPPLIELTRLYEGHYFGELALLCNNLRVASIRAHEFVRCMYMTKEDFLTSFQLLPSFHHAVENGHKKLDTTRKNRMEIRSHIKEIKLESEKTKPFHVKEIKPFEKQKVFIETPKAIKQKRKTGVILLNKYLIGSCLGTGSYGRVRLCQCITDKKKYAIKIVKKSTSSGDFKRKSANHSIHLEVAIMRKLDHRNIVKLYEVINDPNDKKLYLIQEYLPNGDLMTKIQSNKRLTHEVARKYLRDILYGVEYLHQHKIIHRDIKPDNLLLSENDDLKIADFGTASDGETFTEVKGTPAFMAPELFHEHSQFNGFSTDTWSIGATLYMMVTGKPPWEDYNEISLSDRIQQDELLFPTDVSIEPHLRNLLVKMLNKNPNARASLQEVMQHAWVTKEGSEPMNLIYNKKNTNKDIIQNQTIP